MRIAVLAWLISLAPDVHAQMPLSLSDSIQQALANSPALQESDARIAASQGARLQAGLRPNPRLTLQSENTRFWSTPSFHYPTDSDTFAYLSQTFESGGKRDRRINAADAAVRRSELERSIEARRIVARVSSAYWTVVGSESLQALLQSSFDNFQKVVEYHRNRVREGAMAEIELLRVQLEADRLESIRRTAEAEALRNRLHLASELGLPNLDGRQLTGTLAEAVNITLPDADAAILTRAEAQAGKQAVTQAEANIKLQRALAKPDPEVLFGYKRTAGYDTLLGGFQINLPLRNRNQGGIAIAEAEVRAASAQQALLARQIRNELTVAYSDFTNRKRLLTEVLEPMRERAREVARIADAAYREGGLDLLRLLDAQRAAIEAEASHLRALVDLRQSVTALRIAAGEQP